MRWKILASIAFVSLIVLSTFAQGSFRKVVEAQGPITTGNVEGRVWSVPFLTWGGDVPAFYANGGLKTKPGSLFSGQGLSVEFVNGDNFPQQIRNYMSGKSPFLRCTTHMAGLASEIIGSDPKTKGVVLGQMTWSAGDHFVVRSQIRTVADLKGKTIALQPGGPHIGLLDDILKTGNLSWNDIKVQWIPDLTGPNGVAEKFRSNDNLDAACVISPDMLGLTGGLQTTGTGADGTVKGARVLVSTNELSRSIADVYIVRKDFYDENRPAVTAFFAGYLKGCEEILDLKKSYEEKGSASYMSVLQMVQDIYGKDVIPTLEDDAHGLICDARFVGHPGNISFFSDPKNPNGIAAMMNAALDLSVNQGYVKQRIALFTSGLDWNSKSFIGYLTKTEAISGPRFAAEAVQSEIEQLTQSGILNDRTIVSFTVTFDPGQSEFNPEAYTAEFARAVDALSKYGNAAIAIRGHVCPSQTILNVVRAGMTKGIIQRQGTSGNYKYYMGGRPLHLDQIPQLIAMIEAGSFDVDSNIANPRETMQAALNLSRQRAEQVRNAVIAYAQQHNMQLDQSQIQPAGVGIREPLISLPRNMGESGQNMRVEFSLIRVSVEPNSDSDFDY